MANVKATDIDLNKCKKSPTGEHVWNWSPRPDNQRLGTCRYCELQRMFEGAVASECIPVMVAKTAAKTGEAVELQAGRVPPTEKPDEPRGRGQHLPDEDRAEIVRRLQAGETPPKIVKAVGCTNTTVYKIRRKLRKEQPESTPKPIVVKPPADAAAKPWTLSMIGNTMSQIYRLKRGEIPSKNAYPVLERYRGMLCYQRDEALKLARAKKSQIAGVDEIMAELKAVEEEGKKTVEKIAALVG